MQLALSDGLKDASTQYLCNLVKVLVAADVNAIANYTKQKANCLNRINLFF